MLTREMVPSIAAQHPIVGPERREQQFPDFRQGKQFGVLVSELTNMLDQFVVIEFEISLVDPVRRPTTGYENRCGMIA